MKILISKLSSRGDILQALVVTKHLKLLSPNCEIDWIVEKPFCEIITQHPDITNPIIVDTKNWRKSFLRRETRKAMKYTITKLQAKTYDVVFDLQGNTKSAIFTFFAKARAKVGFGFKTAREWMNPLVTSYHYNPPLISIRADYVGMIYYFFQKPLPCRLKDELLTYPPNAQDKVVIDQLIQSIDRNKTIYLICPQSAWENKCLSYETLVDFLQKIQETQNAYFIFSWGSEKEKMKALRLQEHFQDAKLAPKIDLCSLHYLMNQCDYVFAMDSICLHLAATTQARSLSVFGPSIANYYAPKGHHQFYQGTCPYGMTFPKRCKEMRSCKTGACMKNIKGQDLFEHFALLDKSNIIRENQLEYADSIKH